MVIRVLLVLQVIYGDLMLKTPLMVLLRRTGELDNWTKELDYIANVATIQVYNMGLYKNGTVLHVRGDTPFGNTINISKKIMDNYVDIAVYSNYMNDIQSDMCLRCLDYMQQHMNEEEILNYIVDNIS